MQPVTHALVLRVRRRLAARKARKDHLAACLSRAILQLQDMRRRKTSKKQKKPDAAADDQVARKELIDRLAVLQDRRFRPTSAEQDSSEVDGGGSSTCYTASPPCTPRTSFPCCEDLDLEAIMDLDFDLDDLLNLEYDWRMPPP